MFKRGSVKSAGGKALPKVLSKVGGWIISTDCIANNRLAIGNRFIQYYLITNYNDRY